MVCGTPTGGRRIALGWMRAGRLSGREGRPVSRMGAGWKKFRDSLAALAWWRATRNAVRVACRDSETAFPGGWRDSEGMSGEAPWTDGTMGLEASSRDKFSRRGRKPGRRVCAPMGRRLFDRMVRGVAANPALLGEGSPWVDDQIRQVSMLTMPMPMAGSSSTAATTRTGRSSTDWSAKRICMRPVIE